MAEKVKMLGKDLYKIEVNVELTNEKLRSLVFFYGPLIGHDALVLYQYLVLQESTIGFDELNSLLLSLNISVDSFETQIKKMNEYRLVRTLNKENKYIFVFNSPLTRSEFIKDDIFVRDFILKTSGTHYQELAATIFEKDSHADFDDVSATLSLDEIKSWSKEDETYLKNRKVGNKYNFNTLFDVNVFLKDVNLVLLPARFRTEDNMKQLAQLADLYSISYDKMRTFLPKIAKTNSNNFDIDQLRYLCMNAKGEYKDIANSYHVPCINFLMKLQDGKEVTEYDKRIIYNLSNDYHLNIDVINVLLEFALKNCDNSLRANYVYAIASDLHRNNIQTSKDALARLNRSDVNKDAVPTYDVSKNKKISQEELDSLLSLRGKQ